MANKHLIGKQVLELAVSSSDDQYAMQQKMSELVWKDLLPELSKLFDKIVGEDEVIRLGYLELDLGIIQLQDKNTDKIVAKIVRLLNEKIKVKLQQYSEKSTTQKTGNHPLNKRHSGLAKEHGANEKEKIVQQYLQKTSTNDTQDSHQELQPKTNKRQLLRRYYFDLWLHWLEKGVLPPYAIAPEDNWIELVLETLAVDLDATVLLENKLRKHPIAFKRLVLQHTSKDLTSLVELYTTIAQARLLDFFNELQEVFSKNSLRLKSLNYRALEISAWKLVFDKVILQRKKLDSTALAVTIIKLTALHKLLPELHKISKSKPKTYPLLQELCKEKDIKNTKADTAFKAKTKVTIDALQEDGLKALENTENLPVASPQFFKNAGIVLLHPFLSNFFKKLSLLEANTFKDFHSQSKAVMLLHFLATGSTDIPEYEMTLSKFLCEMPAHMPLDRTLRITKEEKEEAHNLLVSAITHWGVLGGTSPDGLREGFLCREGKLEQEGTGWKLHVEQKTIDILLDRLPWNLSLIKLPWMKEILKVEWR